VRSRRLLAQFPAPLRCTVAHLRRTSARPLGVATGSYERATPPAAAVSLFLSGGLIDVGEGIRHRVFRVVNLPGRKVRAAGLRCRVPLSLFVRPRRRSSGLHPQGWWLLVTSRCPGGGSFTLQDLGGVLVCGPVPGPTPSFATLPDGGAPEGALGTWTTRGLSSAAAHSIAAAILPRVARQTRTLVLWPGPGVRGSSGPPGRWCGGRRPGPARRAARRATWSRGWVWRVLSRSTPPPAPPSSRPAPGRGARRGAGRRGRSARGPSSAGRTGAGTSRAGWRGRGTAGVRRRPAGRRGWRRACGTRSRRSGLGARPGPGPGRARCPAAWARTGTPPAGPRAPPAPSRERRGVGGRGRPRRQRAGTPAVSWTRVRSLLDAGRSTVGGGSRTVAAWSLSPTRGSANRWSTAAGGTGWGTRGATGSRSISPAGSLPVAFRCRSTRRRRFWPDTGSPAPRGGTPASGRPRCPGGGRRSAAAVRRVPAHARDTGDAVHAGGESHHPHGDATAWYASDGVRAPGRGLPRADRADVVPGSSARRRPAG
jgi:hypothetical protein